MKRKARLERCSRDAGDGFIQGAFMLTILSVFSVFVDFPRVSGVGVVERELPDAYLSDSAAITRQWSASFRVTQRSTRRPG